MIYNKFWFPWKVPSLNELNEFRMIQGPARSSIIVRREKGKKKLGGLRFNKYNEVKQKWSKQVCDLVQAQGFEPVEYAYFSYLVVEKTVKRDPSNICSSAIKFIEDGLQKAGVISDDRWANVLGIRPEWILFRKATEGVFVVMSDNELDQETLVYKFQCFASKTFGVNTIFSSKTRELKVV